MENPENNFDYTGGDITSSDEFGYYYYTGEIGRPFSVDGGNPPILTRIATPPQSSNCADLDALLNDWRAYQACYSQLNIDDPDCKYLICCKCCSPPPPPTENPFGVPLEGRSSEG